MEFTDPPVAADVAAQGPGWYDIESLGELYRFWVERHIVEGPDGATYDATWWSEEWGIVLPGADPVLS